MHAVDRLLHGRYSIRFSCIQYLFLPLWYLRRMGHVICQVELKLTVPRVAVALLPTMSITIRPARVRIPLPVSTETTIN
jgi:hypothetical protein